MRLINEITRCNRSVWLLRSSVKSKDQRQISPQRVSSVSSWKRATYDSRQCYSRWNQNARIRPHTLRPRVRAASVGAGGLMFSIGCRNMLHGIQPFPASNRFSSVSPRCFVSPLNRYDAFRHRSPPCLEAMARCQRMLITVIGRRVTVASLIFRNNIDSNTASVANRVALRHLPRPLRATGIRPSVVHYALSQLCALFRR